MGYSGGIQFLEIPLGQVDWVDHLRFDGGCECDHAIISDIWKFQNCTIGPYKGQYAVLDSNGVKRGWIEYDVEDGTELSRERCVVVGRKHKFEHNERIKDDHNSALGAAEYYMLVVRPTSVDAEYKRVGVGLIQSDCVVGERTNVRVV